MTETRPDVLVVGAGPTGLVLAIVLTKLGVRVRIIDKTAQPGTTSRALAVQARTLELYRTIDLADEVVRRGLALRVVNLWRGGVSAARLDIGDIGKGISPYPSPTIFPQDQHERLLIDKLGSLGVFVERGSELVSFGVDGRVTAKLRAADGAVGDCEVSYLAGCDGARSVARTQIHTGFPGGTYDHLFYVADLEARGKVMNQELHIILDSAGFLGLFPLAGDGRARLIGTVKDESAGRDDKLGWDDVDKTVIQRIGLEVGQVHWFSTYRVHHRVADSFRSGPVFLLGDAAHIHSPVGGQGMNTGIGDAWNLGWKLAAVLGGRADANLLDTYEPERIAFARQLVSTTDRVFQVTSGSSKLSGFVRSKLAPRLASRASHTASGRRFAFRAVSQTGISYRKSSWSEGHAGGVHAGDRLPWVMPTEGPDDNFTPLSSLDWQVHVYGVPPRDLEACCNKRGISLCVFSPPTDKSHPLRDDQLYLVRPDGYLGLVAPLRDGVPRLESYLDTHRIRSRSRS